LQDSGCNNVEDILSCIDSSFPEIIPNTDGDLSSEDECKSTDEMTLTLDELDVDSTKKKGNELDVAPQKKKGRPKKDKKDSA